ELEIDSLKMQEIYGRQESERAMREEAEAEDKEWAQEEGEGEGIGERTARESEETESEYEEEEEETVEEEEDEDILMEDELEGAREAVDAARTSRHTCNAGAAN
ncbi:hypothetical protein JCM11641_003497, partial [Rhodosporidiobolus odoratus]